MASDARRGWAPAHAMPVEQPSRRSARPRSRWAWPLVIGLGLVVGAGGGSALALWSDQHQSADVSFNQSVVGFSVTKSGDAPVVAQPDGDHSVQFSLGRAEAAELVEGGPDQSGRFWLAVPFDVSLLTSAGAGMDYTLAADPASPETILGWKSAKPFFFPVDDPAACTTAAAAEATPHDPAATVSGIAAGAAGQRTRTDHWCAAVAIQPDVYQNTASAQGQALDGTPVTSTPQEDASWFGYLLPPVSDEPVASLTVTLTPDLTAGCPS